MNILVTGAAGFIGFHLVYALNKLHKVKIIGIDNINNYYDTNLKKNRLKILKTDCKRFNFIKVDICDDKKLKYIFKNYKINIVIHLAAQAGVRYSIENPKKYLNTNIAGFFNIINFSTIFKIKHLIYASSSSVYGNSNSFPLGETADTSNPLSFYASTKKSNEIIAHSFNMIHNLKCTGLRFFTVYGPFGRPDMSLFKFCDSIVKSRKINLFNKGKHMRDFTYIDDVVKSIILILNKKNNKNEHDIYNICSKNPKSLKTFVNLIEKNLNKKSKVKFLNIQKGDVYKTHGNNDRLVKYTKYKNFTPIEIGIPKFVKWYNEYYNKKIIKYFI